MLEIRNYISMIFKKLFTKITNFSPCSQDQALMKKFVLFSNLLMLFFVKFHYVIQKFGILKKSKNIFIFIMNILLASKLNLYWVLKILNTKKKFHSLFNLFKFKKNSKPLFETELKGCLQALILEWDPIH